jgi:tRNA threonylcarbamoyl adenosine modification protein (Sua5/YciO/YrdC/YwlC family)
MKILRVDRASFDPATLEEPARALAEGALVAFPTETVYGIAVRLDDAAAVRRLLDLRGSPDTKLISTHIADRDAVARTGARLTVPAQRLMARFWPGPVTIVFPRDGDTIGIRFPSDPIARELIRRAGVRVGAPSANRSGEPPAVDDREVVAVFREGLDYLIAAGPTQHRGPSTVVDATDRKARVLREGVVPARLIEELNYTRVLFVCSGNTCRSPMAAGLLRREWARRLGVGERDLESRGIRIESAGTAAGGDLPPSETAEDVAREAGIDISGHRSRPVTATMLADCDLVYAMTRSQVELLRAWAPEAGERIRLLDPDGKDIEDPAAGSREEYRWCLERIRAAVAKRMAEIEEAAAP